MGNDLMAVHSVYRLNVDYTFASQINPPSNDTGKVAFVPFFTLGDTTGTQVGTATNPLVVSSSSGGAAGPATGTNSAVASGVVSATILASNAARKGATITNTDANALYLDLSGGTASSTNFSVQIASNAYYEVPFGYTGKITGIWAADGSGSALVTEFS
jgi:hypothetical protein